MRRASRRMWRRSSERRWGEVSADRSRMDDVLSTTTRLLVRSGIEIGHLLKAMLADGDPVTVEVGKDERLLLSRLLHVDVSDNSFVLAWSESKEANRELLSRASVTMTCNHGGMHYGFVATAPRETMHEGSTAVRFAFPIALFAHRQRAQPRILIPSRVPLECKIGRGLKFLDARIVDISLEGIGTILDDPGIQLEPGTRLVGTRIRHPERGPVVVDLEVRYSIGGVLPGGKPATRSGCRLLGASKHLHDLIRLFVTDLDAKP